MMGEFPNKIGGNIHGSLKKETQLFGKNMKRNFGKIITQEFDQMAKMENMRKPENQMNNQIFKLA